MALSSILDSLRGGDGSPAGWKPWGMTGHSKTGRGRTRPAPVRDSSAGVPLVSSVAVQTGEHRSAVTVGHNGRPPGAGAARRPQTRQPRVEDRSGVEPTQPPALGTRTDEPSPEILAGAPHPDQVVEVRRWTLLGTCSHAFRLMAARIVPRPVVTARQGGRGKGGEGRGGRWRPYIRRLAKKPGIAARPMPALPCLPLC